MRGYIKFVKQEFDDFISGLDVIDKEKDLKIFKLEQENEYLKLELNNYENDYLGTENLMLKDKVKEQDELLDSITQENAHMEEHIKELEQENSWLRDRNNEFGLQNSIVLGENEELIKKLEIKEKQDADKAIEEDYYNTKTYDNRSLSDVLEKITGERNTYKEVINIMCDKFNIEHDAVFNIIDDISQNKSAGIERV